MAERHDAHHAVKPPAVPQSRRIIDEPRPGFYMTRLVRGGPFLPARIWVEIERHGPRDDDGKYWRREEKIFCEIGDELVDVLHAWPGLRPINEGEWRYLKAKREWAADFAPHLPEARPRERINLNKLPPIY